jgi:hypothetical protein
MADLLNFMVEAILYTIHRTKGSWEENPAAGV